MIVDGVFSGGGIKGFAYVGAIRALEEKGVKFERVAGTSAGAIWQLLSLRDLIQRNLKKFLMN